LVIRAAVPVRRAGSGGGELKRRVVVRRIVSILALTLSVTALAAIGLNAEVFGGFQRRATDALFPSAPDDQNIAVVGFDTKTINTEGLGYPLPREDVARLIDNLDAAGARVIAFDVIYREAKDGDAAIRDSIDRAGNVVLAQEPTIGPARDGVYSTSDLSPISPVIAETTGATVGQVHLNKDPSDGISRSVPLVVSSPSNDRFIPALAVAAVMRYRGLDPNDFVVRPDGV
jgi:CHASE2 domain-containing sensor protein